MSAKPLTEMAELPEFPNREKLECTKYTHLHNRKFITNYTTPTQDSVHIDFRTKPQ